MVSPIVEPSRTGFTTSGRPKRATSLSTVSALTPCVSSSSSKSGACSPAPAITELARALSMQSADASTPEPVYGRASSSSIPWTVPSSPRRPWSALKTQAKSPSRRTSHALMSRSTPATSWPRPRSASSTCAPEWSDTSRSAERPPRSTAIFNLALPLWGEGRRGEVSSFPFPHQLDLTLELDAKSMHDRGSRALDERGYLDGRRAAFVDDEISMQLRDDRHALACAFEAGRLDQPPRRVSRRVHEHAPAVLRLDGLSLVPLP